MAQGHFTKEEGIKMKEEADELFSAIPKSKQLNYIGHLNDILLFLSAAISAAPNKADKKD